MNRDEENSEFPPDEHTAAGAARRDFRRGNINFDFLQPEERRQAKPSAIPDRGISVSPQQSSGAVLSKRGMFERIRPGRPVGISQIFLWAIIFLGSILTAIWIVILGHSLLWLLALPLLFSSAIWSLLMLALFAARPR